MRRIQLVILLILIVFVSVLSPIQGQNRITQGSINSCNDEWPVYPESTAAHYLVWCDENEGTLQYTLRITSSTAQQLISEPLSVVNCKSIGNSVRRCVGPMSATAATYLNDPSVQFFVMVSRDAEHAISQAAQTPAKTCRYFPPGVAYTDTTKAETRPVDTAIGGQIAGANIQSAAERIGQMRRDGWRVEWQWDSENERIVLMMWCLGLAQ